MANWVKITKRYQVPDASGCYVIFDLPNSVIYVGQSKDLKTRLYHHPRWRGERYIKFSVCKTTKERLLLERFLIAKLKPVENKSPGVVVTIFDKLFKIRKPVKPGANIIQYNIKTMAPKRGRKPVVNYQPTA